MNLISCDNCGVVLDKDKLSVPDGVYGEDGYIDDDKAMYISGEGWVQCIKCPVCNEKVAI